MMTYEKNTERLPIKIQTKCHATSNVLHMHVQYVTPLTKDYGCMVTVSNRQKMWISTAALTIYILNWGISSGRSKVSYIKCKIFAK
jgi:hypothetical protein